MNSKLLKAWEAQVFPKIRSRFQRESDRQAGYDQIKGALQSGMPELAKMIIEGLYDDARGIPADLHLPTFDDLKASANTLGATQLKKGMRVAIKYTSYTLYTSLHTKWSAVSNSTCCTSVTISISS